MALLDVSDILLDPDFLTTGLSVERLAQTVGTNGLAVNTPTTSTFAGVVTNDKGDVLERIASGERVFGSITIHTRFRLSDGRAGESADVVTFGGRRYTVAEVHDWSHFGRGFVAARCDLIPLAG